MSNLLKLISQYIGPDTDRLRLLMLCRCTGSPSNPELRHLKPEGWPSAEIGVYSVFTHDSKSVAFMHVVCEV